jgi:DNA-binding SARP family transcriptional activator
MVRDRTLERVGHLIDLEILGPLVVRADDKQIRLGPMLRVLLLALLCAHGDLVPASRLASLLSETGTPNGSPATLRSHISHLRRAINGDAASGNGRSSSVLVTDHVGGAAAYALRVQADRIDASRFERHVATGIRELHISHFERAGEVLKEATLLWRGQPLADAAGRAFAQAEIRRLESSYRAAVIAKVQADVQRGMHRAVIGELEAMAATWPDDEAVRVLLVICLYRSGRPAEAARACRAAVEAALEQGLDSRLLSMLQRDVLSGSLPAAGLPHLPLVPGPAG